jgi:hypothetical protein
MKLGMNIMRSGSTRQRRFLYVSDTDNIFVAGETAYTAQTKYFYICRTVVEVV